MERLTRRHADGTAELTSLSSQYYLADGGRYVFTPEAQDAIYKLAEYEDAEEAGTLLRLPCPIGTQVYTIRTYNAYEARFVYEVCGTAYSPDNDMTPLEEFEAYWFLTRAEAEAALVVWGYVAHVINHVDEKLRDRYVCLDDEDAFLVALGAYREMAKWKERDNAGTT